MGSNVKGITMAKRESIVPGLGKKQAIVFNNREARQLEHKRHVQELGFPEEQDKQGRPEEEGASLRYAPVSYDDPENPTPSKIVNQAGQDLGKTNRDPVMYKEDIFDMKSVVRDIMKDVPVEKQRPSSVSTLFPNLALPGKKALSPLAKLAKLAGAAITGYGTTVAANAADEAAKLRAGAGGAAGTGFKIIGGVARAGAGIIGGEVFLKTLYETGTIDKDLYESLSLKDNIDDAFQFGYKIFADKSKYEIVTPERVKDNLDTISISMAIKKYSTENPDKQWKDLQDTEKNKLITDLRQSDEFMEAEKNLLQDVGKSREEVLKDVGTEFTKDEAEALVDVMGVGNVEGLSEQDKMSIMSTAQDYGQGVANEAAKVNNVAPKYPVTVEVDPKAPDASGVPQELQPGGLPEPKYGKTGEGPQNVLLDSKRAEGTPVDAGRVDEKIEELKEPDFKKPGNIPEQLQADPGKAFAEQFGNRPDFDMSGSQSAGRTLSVDEGLIDGKQFGTISYPSGGDNVQTYRIEVDPNTYPDAKQGSVIPVPDSSQAMFDAQKKIAEANPSIQPKDSPYLKNVTKMEQYKDWIQKAEDEGAMAKVQLDRVSDLADMMHDILEDEDQLPGWIQNKISDSLHNLEASISYIMYDEKEEQGLVKSKDVFNNILNKEDIPLEKGIPSLLAKLPKLFKFGKKGKDAKGLPKSLVVGTGLAGLFGVNAAAGLLGDKEAEEEYNNADAATKAMYDEQVKNASNEAINSLSESQKKEAAEMFDTEFRGLSAAQIADIGQADRDAIAPPSQFKDVGYVKPIFDTNPEYDKKVKEQGAPEIVVGYETQAGSTMFNKPMTRAQFGTGAQFAKSFLMKQPPTVNLGADQLSRSVYDPSTGLGTTVSDFGQGQQTKTFKGPDFKPPTAPTTTSDPFDDQNVNDAQSGILQISPETETSFGRFATGAAGKSGEDATGGGVAGITELFKKTIVKEVVSEFVEKAKKKGGRKKDPRLARAGVEGFNKPKRTPKHPKKSHIVVAKEGNKIKTIRYGEQGAKTAGDPKKGESTKMKKKRKSFKARHRKNIKRGKMSAAYWADKSKW